MHKVKLGDKEVALWASPLALYFYQQAFNRDLIADLMQLQSLQDLAKGDFSKFRSVLFLQIAYAMNRAAEPKERFPGFEQWLSELDGLDFGDPDWIKGIVEVATDGFFRSARSAAPPEKTKPKKK